MRRLVVVCVAFALLAAVTVPAVASISIATTGPGSMSALYEGDVTFPQVNFTGAGTVIGKTVTGLGALEATVRYSAADLDFVGAFGSGFRWAEIVTNPVNSGITWYGFQIELVDTSATFSGQGDFLNTGIGGSEVPGFASINLAAVPNPTITVLSQLGTPDPSGNVMYLSPNQREISIVFGTPIAPGQSFGVHIPIENLGNGDGSFKLSESGVVPEPATIAIWSVLGVLGIAAAWYRRARKSA